MHVAQRALARTQTLVRRSQAWVKSPVGLRAWLRERDLIFHAALLLILALLYTFIELANAIRAPGEASMDHRILLALRKPGAPDQAIGPDWFKRLWLDVTALGSGTVITMLALAVIGFLLLDRRFRVAFAVAVAVIGAAVLTFVLKDVYSRPRPEFVMHLVEVSSPSFPSGHSLTAAVMYPTLGALAAEVIQRRRGQYYVMVTAAVLTFLVGFSRVYLGVHYPSDVLAGWCAGLSWAIVCWISLRHVERRKKQRMKASAARSA